MSRTLYHYYEKELYFLRQSANEFARQYPATAGRLLLESTHSVDPHVERLLQGVALLAGRVQHKLDDEFPELTTALLGMLYPHYLAPIPSFAIVQFEPDAAGLTSPEGFVLPRGSRLKTQPVQGVSCRYQTIYPVTLRSLAVTEAAWLTPPFPREIQPPFGSTAMLRLVLQLGPGQRFADSSIDRLPLFLHGDPQLVADLYEALLNRASAVYLCDPDQLPGENRSHQNAGRTTMLNAKESVLPLGFELDQALLPSPARSLPGYRLLTEYFTYPQKFQFIELVGLQAARRLGAGRRLEVWIPMNRGSERQLLEQGVEASTFRLHCTPVVNLFEQTAEPIVLTHTRHEYRIVPDVSTPLGCEIYSVDDVKLVNSSHGETHFSPFFTWHFHQEMPRTFWHATRTDSEAPEDSGTEVRLTLVNLDFQPAQPADGVLVVKTTCTNRNLPSLLRQSGERVRFSAEIAGPIARISCLNGPTSPIRPFTARGSYWRLVSHLNLNHLSVEDDEQATEALRGILNLYSLVGEDRERQALASQAIDGVVRVSSKPVVRRLGPLTQTGFCRGLAIELELDEQKFLGHGAYLFACVLERFFALHAAVNSFTQLTTRTKVSGDILAVWPPRAGEQPLR
jgi:type VI secretion system protein ImpG